LPRQKQEDLAEIFDYIDLDTVKVVQSIYSEISLGDHNGDIKEDLTIGGGHGSFNSGDSISISQLVRDVNKRWGIDFGEAQQETLEKMTEELTENEDLQEVIRKNSSENAEMFFKEPFEDIVNNQFETDNKLWMQLNNNNDLKGFVMKKMFKIVKDKVYGLFE
jgi:type I restriction enzyme R subunit